MEQSDEEVVREGSRARLAIQWIPRIRAAVVVSTASSVAGLSLISSLLGTATPSGDSLVTGTIDVAIAPASAVVTAVDMAPGDVLTAPLTIVNSGSLNLRYGLTSTVDADPGSVALAGQLRLRIRSEVTTCTTATFDADGVDEYGGTAGAVFGSVAGVSIVGNPAGGGGIGSRIVGAGGVEILCVQVALPRSTASEFAGLRTVATFSLAPPGRPAAARKDQKPMIAPYAQN